MFEKFKNKPSSDDAPRFEPRWKEELHCYYKKHHFLLEFTMGKLGTYFPIESTWKESAPQKLKNDWAYVRDEAEKWSKKNNAGFYVDQTAWIHFYGNN
ncbi:hypothetical protein [Lentimonas sp. CC11]|uniref:hypothetical protein n=2 Tax=Lentimonas TaxID=417293 RepID=UPI0013271F9A|nr:hypothetical protein [Lentimonas sp. CC11]CAA6691666.1 Unannotated [Lentimonas sp. CC19]CAA6692266.1 Unannotated [Lentimonas sp. CC10]CAA7070207.1 Unannotated [Lentimonas sp. CC11]